MKRQIRMKVQGKWHTVEVEEPHRYPFRVTVDGEEIDVEVGPEPLGTISDSPWSSPTGAAGPPGISAITQEDKKIIRSPMPGRIVSVSVKIWDEAEPGTEICVLETMKMEQSVRLSQKGTVRVVFVQPGLNVAAGTPLIQLE